MNNGLSGYIDSFQRLKILVIGEAMLDSYLQGSTQRLCREAPVPVVSIQDRLHVPGGAANTAVNVSSMGAQAIFLSIIGNDNEGKLLASALEDHGVATNHLLVSPQRVTLAKNRVIASSQMVVRFDQGSVELLDKATESELIKSLTKLFPTVDGVIISDYSYGVLSPGVIQALTRLQERNPRVIVVDSQRLIEYRNLKTTAVKPNYSEAIRLLDLESCTGTCERVVQMIANGMDILHLTGAQMAAVTLDQEGALMFARDRLPYRTYARPEPNSRAAGAGDTYSSALALALCSGAELESAAEIAQAAASIVVSKDGTSTCYADELKNYFCTGDKYVTEVFGLAARLAAYRREGRKIVFTNGCFDLLHSGHVAYLNRAKALGDVLIVGLNSDESVRRLKGSTRPINTLEDRAQVLAALSCVDHIVPFNADTPHELIRSIQPDVFVKGGDYTRATLPEADLVEKQGGQVIILPYLEQNSTTGIIEKIRAIVESGD